MADETVGATEVKLGDRVSLKRTHPCGSDEWVVTRLGMDIGLASADCAQTIRMDRARFKNRFRRLVKRVPPSDVVLGGD